MLRPYSHSYSHSQSMMRSTLPPPPLVDAGQHNHGNGAASWGERIRPERTPPRRNNVQKMQWRSSRWVDGFLHVSDQELDSRISSMTIADVSPRFAVKRIILLYENSQYREAANFINRLSHSTFKVILTELPIDLFVESMPHSLSILEALYAKVFLSDGLDFSVRLLRPEALILQMARVFSEPDTDPPAAALLCSCKKLLKVIVLSEPKLRKALQQRRRALDKAIEGLGQHGLVGTSDETLTNLHDALKVEFQRVVETYKGALQKLDELSLAVGGGVLAVSRGPAPVQASHQRQLSLRPSDVQERLIKNKTLLNVVEPTLGSRSLDVLLGILRRRVDHDKDALFQFTQLRRELGDSCVSPSAVMAPVLMRFSKGCDQVLELMKEVAEDDDDSSDISGYHSDSDSAIMMSGNSPYVSKRARYNFLTRSVRSSSKSSVRASVLNGACSSGSESPPASLGPNLESSGTAQRLRQLKHKKELHKLNSAGSSSSDGTVACCQGNSAEVAALRGELDHLRSELNRANSRLQVAVDAEKQLRDRLSAQNSNTTLCNPRTSEQLVRCYGNLYTTARVDTLDALDNLPTLKDADELKSKILFSVIVMIEVFKETCVPGNTLAKQLAFRSTQSLLSIKKDHVRRVLHVPPPDAPRDTAAIELENAVATYLRCTTQVFDLGKSVEEVCSQIWATLYDYPCLKECAGLIQYVKDAVRLAWCLINQCPPYVLEYEQRTLRKDVHVRFHMSNSESDQIRTYLWPALLEGPGGPCVHKAVVIT